MYSPSTYIPVHVKQYQRKILMDEMLPATFPAICFGEVLDPKCASSLKWSNPGAFFPRISCKSLVCTVGLGLSENVKIPAVTDRQINCCVCIELKYSDIYHWNGCV